MQGMSLVPAVTELMLAELLYLQYDNPTRPIFMYINSAGVQVGAFLPQCLRNLMHSPSNLHLCQPWRPLLSHSSSAACSAS